MRRILKAYTILSCVIFGAILAGGIALAALSVIAPDVVSATWNRGARDGVSHAATSSETVTLSPASSSTPPGGLLAANPAPAAREETGAKSDWIDLGALEARLRLLDRAVPPWKTDSASTHTLGSTEAGRLAAWESLRQPLLALFKASSGSSGEAPRFSENATIESIAGDAAARLEALRAEYTGAAARILKGLEPSAIARLLADERAVTEERARFILARLRSGEATEVMERLSRLAPGRAARLLENLMRTEEKADG